MVANFSVEEMQASEDRAPVRDVKEENADVVENAEPVSDDESSSESEKVESDYDTSEADLDPGTEDTEDPQLLNQEPGLYIKSPCPCCDTHKNENFEQVTPRHISEERFCLKLEHEGSYQCVATGLVFEVTDKVDIIYSILSWCKYDTFLKDNWKLCGPLFDVKSDPARIKSIHFPHSLCLANSSPDLNFKILHIKDKEAEIESATEHSTSHVQWNDIAKAEKYTKLKSVKIDKPTACCKKLTSGKTYRLLSEPSAEIIPEEVEFVDMTLFKCKSFFEVYLEHGEDLQLKLMDKESDEVIWTSKLRECDWASNMQIEPGKQRGVYKNRRRKSNGEILVEDTNVKKLRMDNTADNYISDKQLMLLAEKLGSNWQIFAISCLDLKYQDVVKIKNENEILTMQTFTMLQTWKNKESNNATPSNLYTKLLQAEIACDARIILEGFCNQEKNDEEPQEQRQNLQGQKCNL
ncbi:uncharacterized protein LOC144599285 isoform X4 [Rhinoraja longicauda]